MHKNIAIENNKVPSSYIKWKDDIFKKFPHKLDK